VLDLKTEKGIQVARRLAQAADVLVENFRPGVADRLGIGYDALRADNPGLIYVAISGYGPDGPYAAQPAYDLLIQGLVGIMPIQGGTARRKCSRVWWQTSAQR
jgi:crotonobetainyl-CoA:carnitine CoA-transferase CaiB-like acyl-CoA transferase